MQNELRYDPAIGEFTWIDCSKSSLNGQRAGCLSPSGYRYIKYRQKNYPEHQLAWIFVNGDIPEGLEIDHINRNKADNRIGNLRLATRSEQLMNTQIKPNRAGFRGVSLHKGGLYRARFRDKTTYHNTPKEAAAGYAILVETRLKKKGSA